jgi:hypothetical protein
MISYQKEQFAKDRIRTMLHEAEQERLARVDAGPRSAGLSWRERFALVIGRRFARFARYAAAS